MKGSNTLTSHCGESSTSRADKMTGIVKGWKKHEQRARGNRANKALKKFTTRKRRQFLKSEASLEKI